MALLTAARVLAQTSPKLSCVQVLLPPEHPACVAALPEVVTQLNALAAFHAAVRAGRVSVESELRLDHVSDEDELSLCEASLSPAGAAKLCRLSPGVEAAVPTLSCHRNLRCSASGMRDQSTHRGGLWLWQRRSQALAGRALLSRQSRRVQLEPQVWFAVPELLAPLWLCLTDCCSAAGDTWPTCMTATPW